MRRAELEQHHHNSGKYLLLYACVMAWKEDGRRTDNRSQRNAAVNAALNDPVSRIGQAIGRDENANYGTK
jgi:hypothetical protein